MYAVIILWLLSGEIDGISAVGVADTYEGCKYDGAEALTKEPKLVAKQKRESKLPVVVCLWLPDFNEEGEEIVDPASVAL